jgi:hypothetical protein
MRLILLLLVALPAFGQCGGNGYSYCVEHDLPATASTITDYAYVVNRTDSFLAVVGSGGHIQNTVTQNPGGTTGGTDITVPADYYWSSNSNCTGGLLDFEFKLYVTTTGQRVVYVRIPSYVTGTKAYECYGNASYTTPFQGNVFGTWPASKYLVVLHMDVTSPVPDTVLYDSTSNQNHAAYIHAAFNPSTTCVTVNCVITGGTSYAILTNPVNPGGTDLVLLNFINSPSAASQTAWMWTGDPPGYTDLITGGNLQSASYTKSGITNSVYHLVVTEFNASNTNLYVDGSVSSNATSGTLSAVTTTALAGAGFYSAPYDGNIDESWMMLTTSQAEQTALTGNYLTPGSWATISGEETPGGGSYVYYIEHDLPTPSSTVTDYVYLVNRTDAGLSTAALNPGVGHIQSTDTQNPGGTTGGSTITVPADYYWTSSSSCNISGLLKFEFEKYTAATGQRVVHVRIPSYVTGTKVYECYSNASYSGGFQGDVNGTWASRYLIVYHMPNDGTTVTGPIRDSTSNLNDGNYTFGLMSAGTGIADGGGTMGGSSYVTATSPVNPGAAIVLMTWSYSATSTSQTGWLWASDPPGYTYLLSAGNLQSASVTTPAPSNSVQHLLVAEINASATNLYIDGGTVAATGSGQSLGGATNTTLAGASFYSASYSGTMDEARLMTSTSPAELNAIYGNYSNPGSWAVISGELPIGGGGSGPKRRLLQ